MIDRDFNTLFAGVQGIDPSNYGNREFYQYPNSHQVGHVVQTNVGHTDKWKKPEELQIDFHLRQAGFLEQYDIKRAIQMQQIEEQVVMQGYTSVMSTNRSGVSKKKEQAEN